MTNQIETIMALADDYAAQNKRSTSGRLTHAARQALEAALTPGELVGWQMRQANDDGTWTAWFGVDKCYASTEHRECRPVYTTAPPAQPPDALKPWGEPVATVKSWTNGSYWRNYKLDWHSDVEAGTKLYRAPPAQTPADVESLHSAIMGAVYDFRDAHLTGSPNLQRTAHKVLDAAVRKALTAAPPAQTPAPPPRLTLEEIDRVWFAAEAMDKEYACIRAIETAVRKQFLGMDE